MRNRFIWGFVSPSISHTQRRFLGWFHSIFKVAPLKYSGSPFVIVFKLSCNGLALTTRWATKNYPPRVNIAIITIPFGRVFSWRHCLTAGDSNSVTKRTGI